MPEADAIVKKMAKDERNLIMIAILVCIYLTPKRIKQNWFTWGKKCVSNDVTVYMSVVFCINVHKFGVVRGVNGFGKVATRVRVIS